MDRFPLAPMDPVMKGMTRALMLLPPLLIGLGVASFALHLAVAATLLGSGLFTAAIYAAVWFWYRPQHFALDHIGLHIEWPTRRRTVRWAELGGLERLDPAARRARLGSGVRVGAGGLWGGFGWYWSGRGRQELWVSRMDWCLYCEGMERPGLLITPADPDRFVDRWLHWSGEGDSGAAAEGPPRS